MGDDQLQHLLARLAKDATLMLASEEATKQGVILPVLSRLGWDRENVREIVPEYQVANGRVDYCLRIGDKSSVFVEAKRTDQPLEKHQEQLLEYAFREGVELAALTNGVLWWLYLPILEGSWEQRKFLAIDILQQGWEAAAEHFRSYLARSEVESGSAVRRAKELHRSREKERLTYPALPRAWQLLCGEPDELLVDLIAEKVESLCGHKPTPDQVAQFLEGIAASQLHPVIEKPPLVSSPEPKPNSSVGEASSPAIGFTFTRPTAFTLFGVAHRVSSFKDLLVGVCEAIAARHAQEFERVIQLKGRTRDYFSRDGRGMVRPEGIRGTDIHVEANLSANDTVKRCGQVLRIFGYSQDSLRVETQPLR